MIMKSCSFFCIFGLFIACILSCQDNELPILTTSEVKNITATTATCGGFISNSGSSDVIQRGVCWSIAPNPKISDNKTIDAAGTGEFISTLTGLAANTTYYIRAYATTKNGTTYGIQMSFITLSGIIGLSTSPATDITATSATFGGNIDIDGGAAITERGICWSINPNPTINIVTKTINGSGLGTFTANLSELQPATRYYVRSYATNSVGTIYGNEVTFATMNGIISLSTSTISSFTSTTAICGGIIDNDGGAVVTERGICWGLNANPTIDNNKTSSGVGIGSFSSSITSLAEKAVHYYRAYATNSVGTVYGAEFSFSFLHEGEGTEFSPYNIFSANINQGSVKWVEGYVVGNVDGEGISMTVDSKFQGPFTIKNNILIASKAGETDINKCFAVQLPAGTVRDGLNLVDNAANLGKKVKLYGSLETYFGKPGMKNASYFELEGGKTGGTKPQDVSNAILTETLLTQASFDKFIKHSVLGDQVWTFDARYGAVMSGFLTNTSYANEDWLITPAMNLAGKTDVKLAFDHARGPAANITVGVAEGYYTVWISNNYTSGNPTTVTWTEISGVVHPSTAWGYVSSGNLAIPAANLAANAKIAFKYKSISGASATWEIKNVLVK